MRWTASVHSLTGRQLVPSSLSTSVEDRQTKAGPALYRIENTERLAGAGRAMSGEGLLLKLFSERLSGAGCQLIALFTKSAITFSR